MRPKRIRNNCDVCGSDTYVQQYVAEGDLFLCSKHRHQMVRHGSILDRTVRDKNEVYVRKGVAHIVLRNKVGVVVGEALVENKFMSELKGIKWCLDNHGYARTGPRSGSRLLHRLIYEVGVGEEVDHINGNRLDNRRKNVRIVSRSQNAYNRDKQSNNTSGFRGVWFDKNRGKFVAELKCGKKIHIGRFESFEDAKAVRLAAEKKYFGEFRRTGE